MNVSASALRQLHRIHRQLADLRERLSRGPKQIKAAEANVQRLEAEVDKAKQALVRVRVAADQKQLQLRQREARIDDLKTKLNTCKSNREYQALQEQIAADKQANSVLSDEILELLEQIDEHQARVGTAQETLAKARQELEQTRARIDSQREGLEQDLARVSAELDEAESQLPVDFRADYARMTRVHGDEALAQVENDCCGRCYQVLTPQSLSELRMERPVFCKSCGCLLYLPENRSVGGRT